MAGSSALFFLVQGTTVTFVDREQEHVEAIRTTGLHITGPVDDFTIQAPAFTPEELQGEWGVIILCTKAQHTEEAAQQLAPHLSC